MFEKNLTDNRLEEDEVIQKVSSFNYKNILQKIAFVVIILGFILIAVGYLLVIFFYPYYFSPKKDSLAASYSKHLSLKENAFDLYWKTVNETRIQIAMKVKTNGWAGIGFSLQGQMAPGFFLKINSIGSDVILFYFDKDGKPYLSDRYTTEKKEPSLDISYNGGESNVDLINAKRDSGFIIVEFQRNIKSSDRYDVEIKSEGATNVIWAYNDNPVVNHGDPLLFHSKYGSTEVSFIKEVPPRTLPDKDIVQTIVQMKNVKTVKNETVYLCKYFKWSELGIKEDHHAVKFKALIDNSEILHHMIIYQCEDPVDTSLPIYSCFDDMPRKCYPMALWAVDAPRDVGFSIGKNYDNLILQIHYNNPRGIEGIDSSGFAVYSTKNKRKYDAGIMMVGVPQRQIFIPPNKEETIFTNTCNNTCTNGKILLFANAFHMHLIGKKIMTELDRNGQVIDVKQNNIYDFHSQNIDIYDKEIEVYQNDVLKTTCNYNSKERMRNTRGGFASSEEMCYNFIYFYPRVNGPMQCISNRCAKYKN